MRPDQFQFGADIQSGILNRFQQFFPFGRRLSLVCGIFFVANFFFNDNPKSRIPFRLVSHLKPSINWPTTTKIHNFGQQLLGEKSIVIQSE